MKVLPATPVEVTTEVTTRQAIQPDAVRMSMASPAELRRRHNDAISRALQEASPN